MNLSLPIESVGIKATEHRKYSESQKDPLLCIPVRAAHAIANIQSAIVTSTLEWNI